jgi:hypothetical protein
MLRLDHNSCHDGTMVANWAHPFYLLIWRAVNEVCLRLMAFDCLACFDSLGQGIQAGNLPMVRSFGLQQYELKQSWVVCFSNYLSFRLLA